MEDQIFYTMLESQTMEAGIHQNYGFSFTFKFISKY